MTAYSTMPDATAPSMPNLLAGKANSAIRSIATSSPEQFGDMVVRFNGQQASIRPRRAGPFYAEMSGVRPHRVNLSRINVKNFVVKRPAENLSTFITIPLNSGFEVHDRGRTHAFAGTSAHVRLPNQSFHLETEEVSVFVVEFTLDMLRETEIQLTGARSASAGNWGEELRLLGVPQSKFVRDAIALWNEARRRPELDPVSIARQEREAALIENFLLATTLVDSPAMAVTRSQASLVGLARAEDWIESNLDAAITRADLCAVSGLNARTLTRAFERRHGLSPVAFVRERRLDAVQRKLIAAKPGEISVGNVARQHGFEQLGRFAAEYRRAVGELPSETLRS